MGALLKEMKAEGTVPEKVKAYNDANRKVAILCNHKRTVAASHAGQMEKMSERVRTFFLFIYYSACSGFIANSLFVALFRLKDCVTRSGDSSR